VRLISVKYITDGANDTAHLDWEENLLLGAQKLLALYQAHFQMQWFNAVVCN
jgi:adenosylhomocysteine nucleosidase